MPDCRSLPEMQPGIRAVRPGLRAGSSGGAPSTEGKLQTATGEELFSSVRYLQCPLLLQARLARFLQGRTFERSGDPKPIRSDVRIVAATERDLGEDVRNGKFNRELFDLLRVITIGLPPLRQRLDDIPELVDHFVKRYSGELSKTIKGVDGRVMQLFGGHSWPGNVAELEHVVKRACVLAPWRCRYDRRRGGIAWGEDNLPAREETDSALRQAARSALRQRLVEGTRASRLVLRSTRSSALSRKRWSQEAIAVTNGNQVKAAEILGLNRTTLRKKLKVDK